MFNLTANDLFDRDDLLQVTPEPGGCISRGALDYCTDNARGRRGFGHRACSRRGSPWQSSGRHCLIQQPGQQYPYSCDGRRVDFCEGGEGLVSVWCIWEDCKGECCALRRIMNLTPINRSTALRRSPPWTPTLSPLPPPRDRPSM